MRTLVETTEVFKLEELDESAQQTAYENIVYSEGYLDYDWWDFIYDDVKRTGELIGIDIDKIYFSGFSSQGDGACFEGSYKYAPGWRKALIAEYGKDNASLKEAVKIAEQLQAVQRKAFYKLSASVKQRGFYNHSGCTDITVYDDRDGDPASASTDEEISQLLREYMDYIYVCLEREYEYLTSFEAFEETCKANAYEFDEYGNLV